MYNKQFGLKMNGRYELEDIGINGKVQLNCILRAGKEMYCIPSANDEFKDGDNYYYYLAGCPMFPQLPAPISQSCDLSPPIVSISPIFFL